MNAFVGLTAAFLVSGGYLLVWPIYRFLHRRKSARRKALFRLFLLEVILYVPLTGYVVYGFARIPDFHHAFFLFEIIYLLLAVGCWAATCVVWLGNSPEP